MEKSEQNIVANHSRNQSGSHPDENIENHSPQKGNETHAYWYAMRDLKRPNAADPAYRMLADKGFEVFTPLKEKYVIRHGSRAIIQVPVIFDLLFVHSKKKELDEIEEKVSTLQYRYVKGGYYRQPTIVPDWDMNRFINAVKSTDSPKFYLPDEVTPDMVGKTVIVHGGPLDGYKVPLRKMRGTRIKRVFVELKNFVTTEVELRNYDYLEEVEK